VRTSDPKPVKSAHEKAAKQQRKEKTTKKQKAGFWEAGGLKRGTERRRRIFLLENVLPKSILQLFTLCRIFRRFERRERKTRFLSFSPLFFVRRGSVTPFTRKGDENE
jgi:hypothetical protein